jgi:hypothetical protein
VVLFAAIVDRQVQPLLTRSPVSYLERYFQVTGKLLMHPLRTFEHPHPVS